jgi:hypothetical protein
MQALPKVSPEARKQAKAEAAFAAAGVPLDFAAVERCCARA